MLYYKIRETTDRLLAKYNDNSFVRDPSVAVEEITIEKGIKIELVSPKAINYEHAVSDEGVIKLNNKDKKEEQRFSIGHELKHILLGDREYYKKQGIIFKKPYLVYRRPEVRKKTETLRARYAANPKPPQSAEMYKSYFGLLSKYVAEVVSNNIGKHVVADKAYNVIQKLYSEYAKNNEWIEAFGYVTGKDFITDAINKLYDEELADYFAANLLVPTDRFILWEDRKDEEIARVFKVPVECVKKRRKEIGYEIDFTTLTNLSSSD
jgi:Zn-dependent peptidase ImmA (M78 family)